MLATTRDNLGKNETLEPAPTPPSSSSFHEIITRLVMGQTAKKSADNNSTTATIDSNRKPNTISNMNSTSAKVTTNQVPSFWPNHWPTKRSCNAPPSRRFAHPCSCNHHQRSLNAANTNATVNYLPPSASPVYLYDPISKKCLPTTRNRDMLLKDCHSHSVNTHPSKPQQNLSCYYDDLTCDPRRFRCICKPPLQLYYESNQTSFGCVPMVPSASPDGRIKCRQDQVYNVISKECQKIFDVSELPPTNIASVSAIQFLFVTFTLIWFLLLILLVTTKLKKLRTLNIYRGSPATERRRLDRRGTSRNPGQTTSAWLHPFIAAVNGHHHLNQHRTTVDRHTQSMLIDETGPYSDTDFFLANGNRRANDLFSDRNNSGSQLSLNNPPPKFEEIYPSCPSERQSPGLRPPVSTEDLPTYDEAMKLQDTRRSPIEKE